MSVPTDTNRTTTTAEGFVPPPRTPAGTDRTGIRPFEIHVPGEELVQLRLRLAATRWPERETVADRSQGVPLAKVQDLVTYWATAAQAPEGLFGIHANMPARQPYARRCRSSVRATRSSQPQPMC